MEIYDFGHLLLAFGFCNFPDFYSYLREKDWSKFGFQIPYSGIVIPSTSMLQGVKIYKGGIHNMRTVTAFLLALATQISLSSAAETETQHIWDPVGTPVHTITFAPIRVEFKLPPREDDLKRGVAPDSFIFETHLGTAQIVYCGEFISVPTPGGTISLVTLLNLERRVAPPKVGDQIGIHCNILYRTKKQPYTLIFKLEHAKGGEASVKFVQSEESPYILPVKLVDNF